MSAYESVRFENMKRHWHRQSERYTGGDSLVTAIYHNWKPSPLVRLEEHWHAGTRRVAIYHFELTRAGEIQVMPVIGNPFVERIIAQLALEVISIAKIQQPRREGVLVPVKHEAARV